MHIVFGGAFNGKRQYVKNLIQNEEASWHEGMMPQLIASNSITVIAGVEHWVKDELEKGLTEQQLIEQVKKTLSSSQAPQIWVLTDLNRGIVPTERIEREMRDLVGRLYQFLFTEAQQITRIWYGIPQTIKGADQDENLHENRR
ncbi:MAG: bifunctional adenosylcobinamide kinase/adenosylcobinamide-phosphate guanylyltransferase [Planococcus sp. (in: firmicutes)]|uniref:bifunctional adenosylcobinamide kinase/adenosylcobinamide-phosphate guanylyltransferase n=1 Tax=Planococcus halocryophilus TaxID=1215089 RepID=UPI001F1153B4|nr:bifunctional adenosylcobinamide kinase/adenosylcobinamide-phosphate guanylyltransferase [Planococcus halocryophilus]MCH4828092.1 bifunctional adenosylcobinamide kinase/adenosylcobinamide-phosphate guanylyltransferase [Planococcus halocryophilus]